MSELFDTIEMKAAQAEIEALEEEARKQAQDEARREERQRAAKAKRTKAAVSMAAKLFASVVLVVLCWGAGEVGLVAKQLVIWLYAAVGAWLAFWFGAFIQFMFCKGGFMEC